MADERVRSYLDSDLIWMRTKQLILLCMHDDSCHINMGFSVSLCILQSVSNIFQQVLLFVTCDCEHIFLHTFEDIPIFTIGPTLIKII